MPMLTSEIADAIARAGIPELPELPFPADDEDETITTVELVLYRERLSDAEIPLGDGFAIEDAKDYCDQEDTHGTDTRGNGWFVGWRY